MLLQESEQYFDVRTRCEIRVGGELHSAHIQYIIRLPRAVSLTAQN